MLRFWDLLLWPFAVLGGEALAHIEVISFNATLNRDFFWFMLRLISAFVWFGYVVSSDEVDLLLELVVLFD